jgi:hypothetical protein
VGLEVVIPVHNEERVLRASVHRLHRRLVVDVGRPGFKAARREVIRVLLPLIEDEGWFFDTELLYMAQRSGFSIREIPVRWVDDTDSRVDIARTVIDDLKGIARLRSRTHDGFDRSELTTWSGPALTGTTVARPQPRPRRGGNRRAEAQPTAHGLR